MRALYSGSQEVHNLLWKMWSDLYTVSTLRYYDDSAVLVQSPGWEISTSGTLSQECWPFGQDVVGIFLTEKGMESGTLKMVQRGGDHVL